MWFLTPCRRARRAAGFSRRGRAATTATAMLTMALLATACPTTVVGESAQRAEVWQRIHSPYGDNLDAGRHTFVGWWRDQARAIYALTPDQLDRRWVRQEGLPRRPDIFRLDFSTDWCGPYGVATTGPGWDFHAACLRHDFAYRNLKLMDRRWNCPGAIRTRHGQCRNESGHHGRDWNEANRKRVDVLFVQDMFRHCDRHQPSRLRNTCRGVANTLYRLVRIGG